MTNDQNDIDISTDGISWRDNPTIMVSHSSKIQREISECDSLTENGHALLQNIHPLNRSRYKMLSDIAEGGGGIVYEYFDNNTSRKIAIKALHSEAEKDKEKLAFIKEALITANLEHPSIIPIYEIIFDHNNTPMYAMKKLRGVPLTSILSGIIRSDSEISSKYPLAVLMQIFLKVCDATAYAHAQNIAHLDIKPENIMIGEFGDVLLMDWGLAEHIGETYKSDNIRSIFESFVDNKYETHIHGTPGYMAPEQITGGPEEFDNRTDIHGLGALLYSILTCRRPYPGKNQLEIISNTIEGNLPTPQIYAPLRSIPEELSAVALKAMSTTPENRYSDVHALQTDINSFLTGHAVTALKESFYKKIKRYYIHHRTSVNYVLLTFTFLLILGSFLYDHHSKTLGSWRADLDLDLSNFEETAPNIYLQDPVTFEEYKISKSHIDKNGLSIGNNWLYIGQPGELTDFIGDVKVELEFEWSSWNNIDGIEICFNSIIDTKTPYDEVPAGYSIQIASWLRQFNYISINRKPGYPSFLNSNQFTPPKKLRNTLTIEKKGKEISLAINDRIILQETDQAYFSGRPYGKIRIRSWDLRSKLKNITVYKQKRAQLTSPLDVGDSYVEHRLFDKALFEYTRVLKDSHTKELLNEAGKRYLRTIYNRFNSNEISKAELEKKIDRLKQLYWSDELTFFKESQHLITLWNNQKFNDALTLIENSDSIETKIYYTSLLLREKHVRISKKLSKRLLHLVALNTKIKSLDISHYGIDDLSPIKDLKLSILFCKNNRIQDLSPLKDMPLTSVNIATNKLTDISPLKNHKLRLLIAGSNKLSSQIMLNHKTLEVFYASFSDITSIDFLEGHPLYVVAIKKAPVTSLEPLRDCMSLRLLNIDGTAINDFSPLRDIPLTSLSALGNLNKEKKKVQNTDVLNVSNLDSINLTHTTLSDLNFLNGATKLKFMDLSDNQIVDLQPLNTLKKFGMLQKINLSANPITDGTPLIGFNIYSLNLALTSITDISFLTKLKVKRFPHFYNKNQEPSSLRKILKHWDENGFSETFTYHLETILLAREKNYDEIRKRALTVGSKKYVSIQMSLSYDEAKEFARQCGGRLVCFETFEEYTQLISAPYFESVTNSFFLGLEFSQATQKTSWINGKPLTWKLIPFTGVKVIDMKDNNATHYYVKYENVFTNYIKSELPFIIEFDN